jgi:hypothetical protein
MTSIISLLLSCLLFYTSIAYGAIPDYSRAKISSQALVSFDNALHYEYNNSATNVTEIQLPAGTKYYEGVSGSQGGLIGGGNQVYVPTEINPNWVIK